MKTHLLRSPYMLHDADGKPTEPAPMRRDCKGTDDGPNVTDPDAVTCSRCLEHARDRVEYAWKQDVSTRCADELRETFGEGTDGYDVWHERAADVCLASQENLHIPLVGHVTVEWYCKLSPVPERFRNHGWNVKTCYRLEGMGGYEHSDQWAPIGTEPYALHHMVTRDRRALAAAIVAGYRLASQAVPA